MKKCNEKIIELTVNNHPGVMSHITGLFSRRGYNLEGILCWRVGHGAESRIYLLVKEDERMEQIVNQLEKLYDVIEVSISDRFDSTVFEQLSMFFEKNHVRPELVN